MRGELPTGTITMLFSDIEGSTALLGRLGERYGEALSAQRALLRAAFSAGGGQEMGTEGDSFYVVFGSAGDAVRCCVEAQRALCDHDWPGGVAVRVRMGLHSGAPARHEDGYVGLDVHRAARIAAAAHGGQVVLSDATRQLAEPRLPADVSLRDLGFHRLKDIEAPEHIYQLVSVGLEERFPPLKSLGVHASLPVPVTRLIGRAGVVDEVAGLLDDRRLVTVTGPGGVGKTRLATEVAWRVAGRLADGACLVELAAAHVACLKELGISDFPSAVERRREPMREAEQSLEPDRIRAAQERGAAMTLATAAEFAIVLTVMDPQAPPVVPGLGKLSPRERALITLVAQGRTNAQIAGHLDISVRTVRSLLDRIRDKTGYRRRVDLIRLALQAGLV